MKNKIKLILSEFEKQMEVGNDCYFIPKSREISNELDYFRMHKNRYISLFGHINSLMNELNKEVSCLDIGTNLFCVMLKEIYDFNIWTIDINDDWREAVSKVGIDLNVCDISTNSLPFEDNSFDLIVFAEVIEHLPFNQYIVVREIKRVLKPGGFLLVGTPNFARLSTRLLWPIRILCGKNPQMISCIEQCKHDQHYREFTLSELIHLLESAGLLVKISVYETYWEMKKPFYHRIIVKLVPQLRAGITVIGRKPA